MCVCVSQPRPGEDAREREARLQREMMRRERKREREREMRQEVRVPASPVLEVGVSGFRLDIATSFLPLSGFGQEDKDDARPGS